MFPNRLRHSKLDTSCRNEICRLEEQKSHDLSDATSQKDSTFKKHLVMATGSSEALITSPYPKCCTSPATAQAEKGGGCHHTTQGGIRKTQGSLNCDGTTWQRQGWMMRGSKVANNSNDKHQAWQTKMKLTSTKHTALAILIDFVYIHTVRQYTCFTNHDILLHYLFPQQLIVPLRRLVRSLQRRSSSLELHGKSADGWDNAPLATVFRWFRWGKLRELVISQKATDFGGKLGDQYENTQDFEEQNKNRTWHIFANSCENCPASTTGELKVHQKKVCFGQSLAGHVSPSHIVHAVFHRSAARSSTP